jgi:predicted metal-dependent peptidase
MKPNSISKAKARLMLSHPFFATLAMRTPLTIVEGGEDRAWTDGTGIFIRADMADTCTPDQIKTVFCHELSHMSLFHITRMGSRDQDLFNQAADHAINLMLKELDLLTPLDTIPGGWLCDERFRGMSAEQIYEVLLKEQDPNKPKPKDKLHGDLKRPPMSPDKKAQVEQSMRQQVAAASNIARMQGKLAGALARMVGEVLEPEAPWYEALRQWMVKATNQWDDWGKRDRRYGRAIYLPTTSGERMGPIVLIGDTSGSMGEKEMRITCSETQGIVHQVNPENIRVVWADTEVAGEQVFEPHEFEYEALDPKGGGGTDMRVPLIHVEQYDPLFVILATDGYTPWPSEPPPYPLLILIWTDAPCPDWAEVIRVKG